MKKGATAELRSFEYSEWDIKSETDQIHLIIVYRTPDAHPGRHHNCLLPRVLSISRICSSLLKPSVFITGDFNIHMDEEADTDAVRPREILESTGLK